MRHTHGDSAKLCDAANPMMTYLSLNGSVGLSDGRYTGALTMNDFSDFYRIDMTLIDAQARQMRAAAMRNAVMAIARLVRDGARAVATFIAKPSHV